MTGGFAMDTAQLRDFIASYLSGEVSLMVFQERIVQEAFEAFSGTDQLGGPMLADVELRLAEYTNGHLDEQHLNEALKAILYGWSSIVFSRALVESAVGATFIVRTATSSQPENNPIALTWQSAAWVGTGLEKAPA